MYYLTSEIRTNSLQGTKSLVPWCPLFGGSTVNVLPGNERGSDLLRPDEVEEAGSSLQLRAGQPAVTGVGSQQPRHLGTQCVCAFVE